MKPRQIVSFCCLLLGSPAAGHDEARHNLSAAQQSPLKRSRSGCCGRLWATMSWVAFLLSPSSCVSFLHFMLLHCIVVLHALFAFPPSLSTFSTYIIDEKCQMQSIVSLPSPSFLAGISADSGIICFCWNFVVPEYNQYADKFLGHVWLTDWYVQVCECVCHDLLWSRQRARILNVFKWIAVKTTNCSHCIQPSGTCRGNSLFLHLTSLPLFRFRVVFLSLFQLEKFLLGLCENKINNDGYLARPRARIKLLPDYPGRNSVKARDELEKRKTGDTRLMSCALRRRREAAASCVQSRNFNNFLLPPARTSALLRCRCHWWSSFPLSPTHSRSSAAFLWPLCLTLFVGLMRRAALHIASHRSAVVYAKDFSKILLVKLRKCPSRSKLTRCSSALLISLRCGAVGILQNYSKALSL